MIKYAVIELQYLPDHWEGPQLDMWEIYSDISDIKEAEFKRIAYLNHFTDGDPQNVQVVSYKT